MNDETLQSGEERPRMEGQEMKKTMPKYWQEINVVSVAPFSEERVSPFKGECQYLTTGGLTETRITQSQSVSHENRPTRADLFVRTGDVIVAKMKNTLKVLEIQPEYNGLIVSTGFAVFRPTPRILSGYLFFFVRSDEFQVLKDKYAQGSTQKAINNTDLKSITLMLPPLPVQERIVQILQKADESRRKYQESLELANAILAVSFISIFGDPSNKHENFERVPLGKLADVRSGVTKGRKLRGKETVDVPYLRVANVQDGFLDLSEVKIMTVLPYDVDKYRLEDGDILMTEGGDPDKLGRGTVWRNQIERCIHQNHIFRVRTNREKLVPEYLAALLQTQYAKRYFLSCAKRSSNLASVNSTQLKAFPVPLPPIQLQEKFISVVEQCVQATERLAEGLKDVGRLFASMMDKAFTGQLTAEWEVAHVIWIKAQVEFHEILPRLLLLALIREKTARAEKATQAVMLVTALMKYAFLFQMEGNGRHRFYHFVPYHYGPFAKEVYGDLARLQESGFIQVKGLSAYKEAHETSSSEGWMLAAENQAAYVAGTEESENSRRIEIVIDDLAKTEAALADLPGDLKEAVAAILDNYGNLDHNALLNTVYNKYPAYAKKSRLRKRSD